jgi:tetratricopeptide (TPR) repeat protein
LLKEKLALIYEYNKKSLMFIRAADIQISNNNLQIALDILSDGLKLYPDYPTAYLLLGKILVLQGEYTKAEKAFTKGAEILNNKSTLDYYINDMEKLRSGDSHFTVSRRVSFASDELNELIDENNVNIDEFISGSKPKNKNREFEDRLDDLAKEISGIKIIVDENLPVSEKPAGTIYQDQEIVTETMANIYLSQRKFREAVNIFEKLKIKLPSRNDYFQKKIDEVKMQMNNLNS